MDGLNAKSILFKQIALYYISLQNGKVDELY